MASSSPNRQYRQLCLCLTTAQLEALDPAAHMCADPCCPHVCQILNMLNSAAITGVPTQARYGASTGSASSPACACFKS